MRGFTALAALALVLAGCNGGGADAVQQSLAYEPSDLSKMDGVVVAQYRELKARAAQALEQPATRGEQAQALGRLAGWYYTFRIDEPAARLLELAAERDPANPQWPALRGHLAKRQEQPALARRWWEQALAMQPQLVSLRVAIAESLITEGRLDEAEAMLRELPLTRGVAGRVLFDLGGLALSRGDAAEAVALFGRALVQEPESSPIRYQLGLAYRQLGDEQRAREYLVAGEAEARDAALPPMADVSLVFLKAFQQSSKHLSDQAKSHWEQGNRAEALQLIRRAVAAAPERPFYRLRLGSYLQQTGHVAEAREAFERVLAQEPGNAQALGALASVYTQLGRRDDARATLESLVDLYPDHTRPRVELAQYYIVGERLEEALDLLQGAVTGDPRAEMPRVLRLLVLLGLGRAETALATAELDVGFLPDSDRLAGILLRIQLHCEPDPCGGGAPVERALARYRDRPTRFNAETLAMALARAGRLAEAVSVQRSVANALAELANQPLLAHARARLKDYESGVWRTTMLSLMDLRQPDLSVGTPLEISPVRD